MKHDPLVTPLEEVKTPLAHPRHVPVGYIRPCLSSYRAIWSRVATTHAHAHVNATTQCNGTAQLRGCSH